MKRIISCALICSILAASGCASIASGTDQNITVTAVPQATIEIASFEAGQLYYSGGSPAIVVLPRNRTYTVLVRASGYRDVSFSIGRRLNGWYFGNILVGWIAGFIIDALTGAMWKLEPAVISVTLEHVTNQDTSALAVVCTIEGYAGRAVYPLEAEPSPPQDFE